MGFWDDTTDGPGTTFSFDKPSTGGGIGTGGGSLFERSAPGDWSQFGKAYETGFEREALGTEFGDWGDVGEGFGDIGRIGEAWAGIKKPFDLESPIGLAKFFSGFTGKVGGAKRLAQAIKYNYQRQKATQDALMDYHGIGPEEAKSMMKERGLDVTALYSGADPMAGLDLGSDDPMIQSQIVERLKTLPQENLMGVMGTMFAGSGLPPTGSPGADVTAQYQSEALRYLQDVEALPRELRESALKRLGGVYGLPGGEGVQEEMIERARRSPLYEAIMEGREAGEEAILRGAAATGGLRSGGTQEALGRYASELERKALLDAYGQEMGGLEYMAGLGGYAPQIAQTMAGVGTTLGMGRTAAAQQEELEKQRMIENLMGAGKFGLGLYESGALEGIGDIASGIGETVSGWF